jgi:hypothetical protein
MISNHRSGPPAGRRFEGAPPTGGVEEKTLCSERLQVERKVFTLSLRENPRGRFLRITEDVSGRHDTVIIPAPGLEDFLRVLAGIVKTSAETPSMIPSNPPPPPAPPAA